MNALVAQAFPDHEPLDPDLAAQVKRFVMTPHEFLMVMRDDGLARIMARADKAEKAHGRRARLNCFEHAAELAAAYDAITHGHRPDGWTRPVLCTRCGPVWVRPGFVERDWQVIDVCPYARIPAPPHGYARPHVRCQDCRFFRSNKESGALGHCTTLDTLAVRGKYHWCAAFRPREKHDKRKS